MTRKILPALQHNGLLERAGRYLDTLGSWQSYRDLTRPEELPQRLADITTAFFGLEGIAGAGRPHLSGLLGAIMALHALEQLTGSLVTFGVRWLGRGEALGRYRGIVWRASPLTPRTSRALNWLIGGRLVAANGYYFCEAGRTWHSQTFTVRLWDMTRTLTHLRSFSLPYREYYFDRELPPPGMIDLVKGDREPAALPGLIGSVNELENMTLLGAIKRAFFAAHWLLIEPEERDEGGPGFVDYDSLLGGRPPGGSNWPGGSELPRPRSPLSGLGGYSPGVYTRRAGAWPSTTGPAVVFPAGASSVPVPVVDNGDTQPPARSAPPQPLAQTRGTPHERIQDRYQGPDGRAYPLLIRGLSTHPITLVQKADAIYYDAETQRWQEITDDEVRIALAGEVAAGRLRLTPDWRHFL